MHVGTMVRSASIALVTLTLHLAVAPHAAAADEVRYFPDGCISGQLHCLILSDDLSHVTDNWLLLQPGDTRQCPISFVELQAGEVRVKSVEVEVELATAPAQWGAATVEIALNGISLGGLALADETLCFNPGTNVENYNGHTLHRYRLQTPYYSEGLPGFVYGGTNEFTYSIGGIVPVAITQPIGFFVTLEKTNATLTFDLTSEPETRRRVLISKSGSDDTYDSPMQKTDRRIEIRGTATENGLPKSGQTIYLRVIDPPDVAAYIPSANRVAGDNRGGAGSLDAAQLVSDGSGKFSTTLTITDHHAGDNYEVLGSYQPAGTNGRFPCETSTTTPCPRTGVLTAWKRVYVEHKGMFRKGAYVKRAAAIDAEIVAVSDTTPFAANDRILLVHGPRLELVPTPGAPLPGPPVDFFYQEENRVKEIIPAAGDVPGKLVLTAKLSQPFGPDRSYAEDATDPIPYLADGVGVITGNENSDLYEPNSSFAPFLFNTAFVEYVDARTTTRAIPLELELKFLSSVHMSKKWYENSIRSGISQVDNVPNYRQLLGARQFLEEDGVGARLGRTLHNGHDPSWVFAGRIERATTQAVQPVFGLDPLRVNGEVTTHELVHQWNVNANAAAGSLSEGHCNRQDYRQQGPFCLMHSPFYDVHHNAEFADGFMFLHYVTTLTGADSEYLTIREANDPMPAY